MSNYGLDCHQCGKQFLVMTGCAPQPGDAFIASRVIFVLPRELKQANAGDPLECHHCYSLFNGSEYVANEFYKLG